MFFGGKVIEGQGNDRAAAGENFPWVTAAFEIAFHPTHVSGMSGFDPGEVVVGMRGPAG